jgi:pimeloyl-ACP methyl ester carboxylesterase
MHDVTFVLLHGAGTGPWVWDRVREELAAPSLALEVPGRTPGATPDDCAERIVQELDAQGVGDIVVVLHSLAAVLAPGLAARLGSRLRDCIFVAGVVPPAGGAFIDALPLPNRLILRFLFRLRRGGLRPSEAMIRRELCNDLSDDDADTVVARYEAELPGLYLTPVPGNWAFRHCAYVKLLDDRSIPPGLQDTMIGRLHGARILALSAGHLAMLSQPRELASLLESAR